MSLYLVDTSSIEYGLSEYGIAIIEKDKTIIAVYGIDIDYDTFKYTKFVHYEYARDEFAKIALNYLSEVIESNGAYNTLGMSPCEMVTEAFVMWGEDVFGASPMTSFGLDDAVNFVMNLTNGE